MSTKQEVEKICDYVKDRTIEYGLWVNDLGMFGTDIPHFQIISNNYLKCMLRRDIKDNNVTTLSGKQLDKVISAALTSLQKIYVQKHRNVASEQNPN